MLRVRPIISLSILFITSISLCSFSIKPTFGQDLPKSAPSKTKTIIVGGDHYYPPYEFLDKEGKPTGFNVELTHAIAEIMGFSAEIRLGPWSDMRQALEDNTIDALQGMVYSDERAEKYSFSPAHSVIHQSVFARKDSPELHSLNDLQGKNVIVQKNGIMHDYIKSRGIQCTLIEKETHAQALRLLASGKYDYAVVANLPGLYLSQEFGLSNLVQVAEPTLAGPYGYAVQRGNIELLSLFSEGLSILKNTGRYEIIKNKWLSPLDSSRIPLKNLLKYGSFIFLPLLFILVGISVWNKMLQRKVATATSDLKNEIVQRKKAAEESSAKQQQLIQADKMATLGTLVSGVAHEINNPTGLILLNIPVLKKTFRVVQDSLEEQYENTGDYHVGGMKYSVLREQIPQMLDETLSSAKRIKRIVSELKDFARIESSELSGLVDVNKVVEASSRLVTSTIRNTTTDFSLHCEPALPLIQGNKQRLEQVVVNLIVNACQALQSKEQAVVVTTRYDKGENEIVIEVADEGIGIKEQNMSQILDPFFTTKRNEGGTGLGLSISSGIVKDHGGSLSFTSLPSRGTNVTLSLPVANLENQND